MKRTMSAKFLLVMTVTTVLLGGAGVAWVASNRSQAQADFQSMRKQIRDEKKVQAELQEQKDKLLESSEKLAHLEAGVPDSAYIPTLLSELEAIGRSHGLDVTGVKPKEVKEPTSSGEGDAKKKKDKKPYNELQIEVKGTGVYASIQGFVLALQQFPKIVGVISVDLTPRSKFGDKTDDGNHELEVTINLRAYAFSTPEDTASRWEAGSNDQSQG